MKQRSKWVGICAGVLGVTLSLAPLTAASASSNKAKHHSHVDQGIESQQRHVQGRQERADGLELGQHTPSRRR